MVQKTTFEKESRRIVSTSSRKQEFDKIDILGVPVAKLSRESLFAFYDRILGENVKGWIGYVNIHTVNLAHEQEWFLNYLRHSLLNYCDGNGVRLGSLLLGERIPIRFTLADHWNLLCEHFENNGTSVYFLGTKPEIIEKAVQNVRKVHPELNILGWHHGFFPIFNGIDVVSQINKLKPDILFVGMGMPIQEKWIQKNIASLNVKVAWSAGGLFDFLAGVRERPPEFISRIGFEWLYRLLQEPTRLWRRYLIGNPLFLYRIVRQISFGLSRNQGKLSP